jgi:hypothetical protein
MKEMIMKNVKLLLLCLLILFCPAVQASGAEYYPVVQGYNVSSLQKMRNGICPQGIKETATAATFLGGMSLLGALKHSKIYTPSFVSPLGAALVTYATYKVYNRLSSNTIPMLLKQKGELREVFEKIIGNCRTAKDVVNRIQIERIKDGDDEYSLVRTKLFLEAVMKAAISLNKKLKILNELPLPEEHITLLAEAIQIIVNKPEYRLLAQYEKQAQWQTVAKQYAWSATKTGAKGIFSTGLFLTKTITKALIKGIVKNSVTITEALKNIIA